MSPAFDVVVLGGGPAGSVCATRLAQRGVRVLLLEKEHFPRFRLGESLLPRSLPMLAEIGVLDTLEAEFLRKYGARFHDDVHGKKERFSFAGAFRADVDHAFQVSRDAFDHVLLRHAKTSGVDVREGTTARITFDGDIPVVDATCEGKTFRVTPHFVVDATGRDAQLAHASRSTQKIAGLERTAFFAHYEGVPREAGRGEGDIDIILLEPGASGEPQWLWIIPFKGYVSSVGAVVSRSWIREQKTSGGDPTALLRAALAASPTASAMLANATMTWPEARAAADFSYRVDRLVGPRWTAIGDAGGFVDPLFSTGVHLAIVGAKTVADVLVDELSSHDMTARYAWERSMKEATDTFVLAVQAFYGGGLANYLFADDKHVAIRRSVTSLLAGDVFHDAIWLRDARRRLTELRDGTGSEENRPS